MNVACSSCPAKYAVPDEKVRGRKVRITCKKCGAAIIVDGTELASSAAAVPASGAQPAAGAPEKKAEVERPRQKTMLGGLQAAPQAVAGAAATSKLAAAKAAAPAGAFPAAAKAAVASAVKAPAAAAKPLTPKAVVEKPWTVAVTDDDHRDMPTAKVVELYAARTIDAETFIWREGMEDWLTPFEIPEIASALKAGGLEPRTNEVPEDNADTSGTPSGGWREPGKWDGGEQKPGPNYDEVTVAMTAPKAQALLDAAISAEEAHSSAPKAAEASPRPAPVAEEEAGPVAAPKEEPVAAAPAAEAPPETSPEEQFRLPFEAPEESEVVSSAEPRPVAARRAERTRERGQDLFAKVDADEAAQRSRMPSISPETGAGHTLTGARNESSVLFSLDALAGAAKPKPAPKKSDKAAAEALLFGGQSDEAAPPSVANLGGGALFGAAAMAAPDFMAPPAASAPVHSRPSSGPPATAPAKGSKAGLFIGIGALLLVGGGAGAFFFLKPTPPAPAPAVTTPAAPPPAATAVPPAPSAAVPSEPAATTSAAASTAAAVAGSAAPAPATAPSAGEVHPAAEAHPVAEAHPAGEGTPKTHAESSPAAETKAAAPAPAAAGPEFNKEAASAALGAATSNAEGQCASQPGNHGVGKVTITFMNDGRSTNAVVSGDFAGSPIGGCIARVFRGTHVPAFSGEPVRVSKTVRIP